MMPKTSMMRSGRTSANSITAAPASARGCLRVVVRVRWAMVVSSSRDDRGGRHERSTGCRALMPLAACRSASELVRDGLEGFLDLATERADDADDHGCDQRDEDAVLDGGGAPLGVPAGEP